MKTKTELIKMEEDRDGVWLYFCSETGGYSHYGDVLVFRTEGVRAINDLELFYGVEIKPNKRIK